MSTIDLSALQKVQGESQTITVLLTPELANQLLHEGINHGNRPFSMKRAEKFARLMEMGEYVQDHHQGIAISMENGHTRLLDGQHRCKAVALSNKSQIVKLTVYKSQDVFEYIDQGDKRSLGDVMKLHPNPRFNKKIIAVVKSKLDIASNGKQIRTPEEIKEHYQADKEAIDWALNTFITHQNTTANFQAAAFLYAFTLCYNEDKVFAQQFAKDVLEQANLYLNHPAIALKTYIERSGQYHSSAIDVQKNKVEKVQDAFHKARANETVIRYNAGRLTPIVKKKKAA